MFCCCVCLMFGSFMLASAIKQRKREKKKTPHNFTSLVTRDENASVRYNRTNGSVFLLAREKKIFFVTKDTKIDYLPKTLIDCKNVSPLYLMKFSDTWLPQLNLMTCNQGRRSHLRPETLKRSKNTIFFEMSKS